MEGIRFDYSKNEMKIITDECIEKIKRAVEIICELEKNDCTYHNVVLFFSNVLADEQKIMGSIIFLQQVAPEKEIRNTSRDMGSKMENYFMEFYTNVEFYKKMNYVYENINKLNELERKHTEYYIKFFVDYGMKLSSKKRTTLNELRKNINELETEFEKNLSEDTTYILLTNDELKGCNEMFIEDCEKIGEMCKINCKESINTGEILIKCVIPETRELFYKTKKNRCMKNMSIIEQLHKYRQHISEIIGYKNNAEYKINDQTLNNVEDIDKLLKILKYQLQESTNEHFKKLLQMKYDDIIPTSNKKRKNIENIELNYWDYDFYNNKYMEQYYQIDNGEISKHFPAEHVMNEMLNFYGELFQLEFVKIKKGNYSTWHDQVILYKVYDKSYIEKPKENKQQEMGYIYCDLYSREGKYQHFAMFDLVGGYQKMNNEQQLPIAVLVGNFSSPTNDKPSLLAHSDVDILFHEFGHVIHGICGGYKNKYYEFSGTNVEKDYVEIPSQMKEQWIYDPYVLKRISSHYNTGEPLSDELIELIIKSRYVEISFVWSRIIGMSMIDQIIQKKLRLNSNEIQFIMDDIIKEHLPGNPIESITTWSHIAGDYDARYYSYVWTMIVACDLYSKFKDQSIEKQREIGMEYRSKILEPGGTKKGKEMIFDFLGRTPSLKPFLENYIGIDMTNQKVPLLNFKSLHKKQRT